MKEILRDGKIGQGHRPSTIRQLEEFLNSVIFKLDYDVVVQNRTKNYPNYLLIWISIQIKD